MRGLMAAIGVAMLVSPAPVTQPEFRHERNSVVLLAGVVGPSMQHPAAASGPTIAYDAPALVAYHGELDPDATVGLYGIFSGFAKARLGVQGVRKSITVGRLPAPLDTAEWYLVLDRALDEWNLAAGWELFLPDFTGGPTDVTFGIDDDRLTTFGAWTEWDQFDTGWYRGCRVLTHTWGPPLESTVAHELGHCLGFMDVTGATDTGYFGIMSYLRHGDLYPNNVQDVASLEAAGYREG